MAQRTHYVWTEFYAINKNIKFTIYAYSDNRASLEWSIIVGKIGKKIEKLHLEKTKEVIFNSISELNEYLD